ncbi:MAG: hypothetical protein M1817_002121 [Caeruleum heppii]|nr:MAG: hypothetical protein M1817_002121 [Caeruleum heppii]
MSEVIYRLHEHAATAAADMATLRQQVLKVEMNHVAQEAAIENLQAFVTFIQSQQATFERQTGGHVLIPSTTTPQSVPPDPTPAANVSKVERLTESGSMTSRAASNSNLPPMNGPSFNGFRFGDQPSEASSVDGESASQHSNNSPKKAAIGENNKAVISGMPNGPKAAVLFDEEMKSLPKPAVITIPKPNVLFPHEFLKGALGGTDDAFSTVSTRRIQKQVFPCRDLIKLLPTLDDKAPVHGSHGALTLVESLHGCVVGKRYPVFCRRLGGWEYTGEFKLIKRVPMPINAKASLKTPLVEKLARQVCSTRVGRQLLVDKGMVTADAQPRNPCTFKDVVPLLLRASEPCLRVDWGFLECVGYNRKLYDALTSALKRQTAKQKGN